MKKTLAFTILAAALTFTSCSDSDTYQDIETPPVTDNPTPGPETPTTAISYSKNVKAIIDANCVGCHQSGRSAGFRPLTTYAEVKTATEGASLLNRIQLQNGQQGIMPQAGRMSQTNIDLIVKWNTDGLKEN